MHMESTVARETNSSGCLVLILAGLALAGMFTLASCISRSPASAATPATAAAVVTGTPTQTLALSPTAPPPAPANAAPTDWSCDVYANRHLADAPVASFTAPELNHNWTNGAPAGNVPTDEFSLRCARTIVLAQPDNYRFTLAADDGARLQVDGRPVIDLWWDGGQHAGQGEVALTAGAHRLVVEYYNAAGAARLKLDWAKHYDACEAAFFNNPDLMGAPALKLNDAPKGPIAHDWGTGAPEAVHADYFSAWWTCTLTLRGGEYRFHVKADDGMRVIVGKKVIYDNFKGGPDEKTITERLKGGKYRVQVQYAERTGNAHVIFGWERVGP
jgi:hypothetical protein